MVKNRYKKLIRYFFTYWGPVLIWALVIFAFSARPTSKVSEIHWEDFIFKKTIHIIEYFIFCTILYRAFVNSGVSKKRSLFYSFLTSVFYGISDEFHQSFTPGREPKVRDVLFDGLGAFLSIYFISNFLNKSPEAVKKIAKEIEIYEK